MVFGTNKTVFDATSFTYQLTRIKVKMCEIYIFKIYFCLLVNIYIDPIYLF